MQRSRSKPTAKKHLDTQQQLNAIAKRREQQPDETANIFGTNARLLERLQRLHHEITLFADESHVQPQDIVVELAKRVGITVRDVTP
ncbi:MAG TPA: hypothetical protein VJW93_11335 [Candidatus Acidoferrales bacterium]|nr:hypothetical protein [Candidatus Acidoferrales bacterium]